MYRPEGIMLQKFLILLFQILQKSLHYACYYSSYAPHCYVLYQYNKFTSYYIMCCYSYACSAINQQMFY